MTIEQNVDHLEIEKFEKLAQNWWDPTGDFKPLHQLNPLRLSYIERHSDGLFGKKILDVGCGGGILSESMAKLGANVRGIDMGKAPLEVARLHALEHKVEIQYQQITAEELASQESATFDVITCMEMLEHVPNPASVIQACCDMLKPNGFVFFSTINRTFKSYLQAIIGAEYVLKLLPIGTHEHDKFIKPSELITDIEQTDLLVKDSIGVTYNPLSQQFRYTNKLDVNYMLMAQKQN